MSIVTRMGKKSVLHYLYSRNMDDLELNVLTWMNLTNIIFEQKRANTKEYSSYDFIYIGSKPSTIILYCLER